MKAPKEAVTDRDTKLTRLSEPQAAERSRLETLEQKLRAERAELDAKVKVLAEDHVAFAVIAHRTRTSSGPSRART